MFGFWQKTIICALLRYYYVNKVYETYKFLNFNMSFSVYAVDVNGLHR